MTEFAPTLTAGSDPVTAEQAERIVRDLYGIDGRARRQAGERDDNFVVDASEGPFFLKVVHAAEPADATDLVTSVLRHLERAGTLPVQSVVPTRGGEHTTRPTVGDEERAVRLTTYISGRMLHSVPSSPELERELGAVLARVGAALRDFEHPASERDVLWDLWSADRIRPMLDELPDLPHRTEVAATLDRFEEHVRPRLGGLRRQLVHNDLSGDNVVIGPDASVAGIIDFGDAVVTQLVNDVAIGMTNRLVDGDDPLASAVELLRGFHAVVPLTEPEVGLLYDLVRTRTVMRLVISRWRAARFPDNRTYILRNTPRALEHFARMPASGVERTTERLARAVEAGR